ncbi:MAG TPA: BMP family ABC transporter substrate-binding protein, partial [Candidatus Enterocloster faecavium]|nr:BMP family ABC transporter substrate-binding protein [Candidatus Enterocloster faecavium]
MLITHYAAAQRQGRRQYQESLAHGKYPYLPVLDQILSYSEITSTVSLGTIDIPLSRLVGTKTEDRANAFASNFMPLLPEQSEFASKWSLLYNYQVQEGIQDPIIAYEYMNQFYVQEGNKRVSVLKYLGAYSIQGSVTRLIPKRTEEKDNKLYFEFLDFNRVSGNCEVWFSRLGSYRRLLKLMGKAPDEVWDEEERLFFRSAFGRFEKAFHMAHGEKLELTASDAFLVYVGIFGYEQTCSQTEKEMYAALQKIWSEIRLAERGRQVELVPDPAAAKELSRPSLLNWFIPAGFLEPDTLKTAFIYTKTPETSSWTYAHELGRKYIGQALGEKVKTISFDQADTEEQTAESIEKAIQEGCSVIFTTAMQMVNQSVRSAILHPNVKIYNCSIKMSYSSICTYYARMYESKFLMGALAAAISREDQLGYIADYPIYGTMANINAFAMGARMVNPYVKVYLEWSRTREGDAQARLEQKGIRYISGDDMITPRNASRRYGLYRIRPDGSIENLAASIWHWGKFYEQILRIILGGSGDATAAKGK